MVNYFCVMILSALIYIPAGGTLVCLAGPEVVLEATIQALLAPVRQSSFWLCTSNCSIGSEGGFALVAAAAA